jgi:two-component system, chemotaxis family, sensor kinase CheA
MIMDDGLRAVFAEETLPLVAEVEGCLLRIEREAAALQAQWRTVLGALHTIKGNCGMVGLDEAQDLAHALEQRVREVRSWPLDRQEPEVGALLPPTDRLREAIDAAAAPEGAPGGPDVPGPDATPDPDATPGPAPDADADADTAPGPDAAPEAAPDVALAPDPETAPDVAATPAPAPVSHVRVPAEKLDRLLEAVGDLATGHARLRAVLRDPAAEPASRSPHERPDDLLDATARRIADLRDAVMTLRLVPLSMVIARFERLVRDLGRLTGKRAVLQVRGAAITVDKHVADRLAEPLLHVVRNAVDHGIEDPRARSLAGKPAEGTIAIEAEARAGILTLTVRDDGRGVDVERLRAAARQRGVDVADGSPDRLLDLIFAPDLTTAETATALSGRGVGLDQARRALEQVGGAITVTSEPGQGTALSIRVPLVIAVQRALLVRCAGETYAVPFTALIEAVRLPATAIEAGGTRATWRGRQVPLRHLASELGRGPAGGVAAPTCLVLDGAEPAALVVDDLAGHQDLIIRELDPVFGRPRGITGAAVLADGRVVAVLDPQGAGRAAGRRA